MIQDEITPHMRMMSSAKRRSLAPLSAGALGLICFVSYSLAETTSRADQKAPDASVSSVKQNSGAADDSIRPFHISVPEEQLVDLRRRIAATRWPERETVSDATQGVQLATTQKFAQYWGTEYGWRKVEARQNALPMFVTEIDGLDILQQFYQRIQRRRGGGKANIALARKFLGVIYHTLKNDWVFEDFPNFVLAS